jgi:hypothetical protein
VATQKELEQRIAELEQLLASRGIVAEPVARSRRPEDQPDYIPFGSDKHMAFLGLERVEDMAQAEKLRQVVHVSPDTGTAYRLIDEMAAAQLMRPMDPDKSILLVLRQKVSSFESGMPEPFPGAPVRFIPPGDPEYTRIM